MIFKNAKNDAYTYDYIPDRDTHDILIDLREKPLYRLGTIPGAVNIPIDDMGQLFELQKDRKILLFCQVGEISAEIAALMQDAGYKAYHLPGGYRHYLREIIACDTTEA